MNKLSVVISAYNEEKKIEDCLKSVRFANEIIVVDNSSIDKTGEIAKKYKAKVITRENNLMLNVNKNFGFTQANSDWILNLDADERVPKELAEEIQRVIQKDSAVVGYWIQRKNIIFGKWIEHSLWWPDEHLRLFKKGCAQFEEVHVHEHMKAKGETGKLTSPLIHESYSSISAYVNRLNSIYTENEVDNFLKSNKKITYLDAIRFPVEDFLKTFFLRQGYKDGLHGLVLSILQSFYSFLIFAKIWERQGFQEHNNKEFLETIQKEGKVFGKKFQYWFLTSLIQTSSSAPKIIWYKILRKKINNGLS